MKVIFAGGSEVFEITHFRIDETGFLTLFKGEPMDGSGVRLNVIAVFAPAGWLGIVTEAGIAEAVPPEYQPIGFQA